MSYDPVKETTTFGPGLQTGGQVQDLGGGKFGVTGEAGTHGDVSGRFLDDPLVNEYAKLPSLEEAKNYMHSNPVFKGVQRSGDYRRVVQREMANEASGNTLSRIMENRTEGAKAERGDLSPNPFAIARMFDADPTRERRRQREDLDLAPRPLRDRGIGGRDLAVGGDFDEAERLMRSRFGL